MEINLLPGRSLFEKYRLLLITVPTLLLLGVAILFFVKMIDLNADIVAKQGELMGITSQNISLEAERTMDSKTKLFRQIQQAVHNVQEGEHAPGPILDGITGKLPDQTRVLSATMDADSQKVTLSLASDSIDSIAKYADLLRADPWVKDVVVQDIEQTKGDSQAGPAQTSVTSNANTSGISSVFSSVQTSGPSLDNPLPFKTQVIITLAPTGDSTAKSSK